MWQAVKSVISKLLKWLKVAFKWGLKLLIPIVVLYALYGWYLDRNDYRKYDSNDRYAAAIVDDPIDPPVGQDQITYLPQNWSANKSNWFYFATQGSNLIPYDFFLFLEQKDSDALFNDAKNMNMFRYLPQRAGDRFNTDALPVGMTKDSYEGRSYMGFTCAACHTSQINYVDENDVNRGIRIDGGPAASDMEGFMVALADALDATRKNQTKLSRFKTALANHKGGDYEGPSNAQKLIDDLNYFAVQLRAYVDINSPLNESYSEYQALTAENGQSGELKRSHYGFARLDAFGRIFNRGLQHVIEPKTFRKQLESNLPQPVIALIKEDLDEIYGAGLNASYPTPTRVVMKTLLVLDQKTPPEHAKEVTEGLQKLRAEIYNSADAAASYPYLWDVPQHDYIQWTGLVSNSGLGPLGRNTGQVIGVFGTLDWQKEEGYPYLSVAGIANLLRGGDIGSHFVTYKSSIDKGNLRSVELALRDLWSPEWPEDILGKLDDEKKAKGRKLFVTHCQECHHDLTRDDPERRVIAHISDLESAGTDPVLAENAVTARGSAGILSGKVSGDMLGEIVLTEDSPVPAILRTATQGVIATADPDKSLIHGATEWVIDIVKAARNNDVKPTRRMGNYDLATTDAPYAPITGYKARPLNGIWATAPYMHNGSIPNLYEVLLPERERSKMFMVGSRQFDVEKVGFKSTGYPEGTGFEFDTSLYGNSNAGHEYGTDMPPEDRRVLLEYLKQL